MRMLKYIYFTICSSISIYFRRLHIIMSYPYSKAANLFDNVNTITVWLEICNSLCNNEKALF